MTTFLDPGHVLRTLALLSLAGCSIENPAFMFETVSSTTSTNVTTTDTAPTTTVSTLPSGSTGPAPDSSTTADATSDATTLGESTSDIPAEPPCAEVILLEGLVPVIDDAFFISGSTNNNTECSLVDNPLAGPCFDRNFGNNHFLQFGKLNEMEVMYAVRFDVNMLAENNHIDHFKLIMTGYDLAMNADQPTLQVGLINQQWSAGNQSGGMAMNGDSSYANPDVGGPEKSWTGGDGPRGASDNPSNMIIDPPMGQHFPIMSEDIFYLDGDIVQQLSEHGLVVSYPDGTPNGAFGPMLKALGSDPKFDPKLEVYGCALP